MASLNKAQIIGYLGDDPAIKYLPDGTAVCTVSVATNEKWKDKEGNQKESTEWHRVVCWGKLAEVVGEYLHKGSQAYFEGKIQTRKWIDKDKIERYSTKIRAYELKMLGEPKARARHDETGEREEPQARRPAATPQDYRNASRGEGRERASADPRSFADMHDDVPFNLIGRGISGHAI